MNAVHPHHRGDSFKNYRHFIFAFHDSTFECLAGAYTCEVHSGSNSGVLATVAARIT